jgi:hypothetical protein
MLSYRAIFAPVTGFDREDQGLIEMPSPQFYNQVIKRPMLQDLALGFASRWSLF